MSKLPTSLFSRGSKLLGLASKIALEEVSSKIKTWEDEKTRLKSKVQLAQDVVKTLSQLKGASMKLGQLLSLDMGEYLPPEMAKVLETLHQNSTFLSYAIIERILKEELKERFIDLEDISEKPIAAASIGQVHKARIHGKIVVIKVQYPGIAHSIPSDLRLLEVIMKQLSFFQGKETDLNPLFKELTEVLQKETDYENELRMHLLYREKFQGSPYIIPEALPEYSTKTILTQEFIAGNNFAVWLATSPTQNEKNKIAHLLLQLYLEEFFRYGLVQTDPNPGNFLITPESTLALLDFGAVKEFSSEFIDGYREVLKAAYLQDEKKIIEESLKLGLLDEREDAETRKIFLKMMNVLAAPFRVNSTFDFTDKSFFQESRDLSWALTRKCKYSPPPKELIFLHRKLAGVFMLIRKLDVPINLNEYWHYVDFRS
jgi:aarF domain-containing kinase